MGTEKLIFSRKGAVVKQEPVVETRSLVLNGHRLDLKIVRSQRRSIALKVNEGGPRLFAPVWLSADKIDQFIQGHAVWLENQLLLLGEQARKRQRHTLRVCNGVEFPLFGKIATLKCEPSIKKPYWERLGDETETLYLPVADFSGQRFIMAVKKRALTWYRERVAFFCAKLGYPVPAVRLSTARTRWGSCSRISGIRLHWRLIHLVPELIDYVVAHEVAHLVEMNHSPRFWAVVGQLYPEWSDARKRLRRVAQDLPVIAI